MCNLGTLEILPSMPSFSEHTPANYPSDDLEVAWETDEAHVFMKFRKTELGGEQTGHG